MRIRIDAPATRTIYPEVEGNMDLPEEERFAVVMYRPPRYKLYMRSAEIDADNGGQSVNVQSWALAHVKELVNAPMLDINGQERLMRPADIFEFSVFEALANDVLTTANKLSSMEGDSKNS